MVRRVVAALAALVLLVLLAPGAAKAAGSAPGAPKILGPADGSAFGAYDEQVFKAAAADPDRDRVTVTITVVDNATGLSLSFSSGDAPSDDGVGPNEVAVARPPVELRDGLYTWTATAVDSNGNAGPTSPARSLRVDGKVAGGFGLNASDQCKQGQAMPVDGVIGDAFIRIRERIVGDERWVCVRTDDFGGRFAVRNLKGGPTAGTTTDADAGACAAAPDNTAPGPRPLAAADDGSFVDVYQGAAGVWVCVQAGSMPTRLVLATPRTTGATSISYIPDLGGWRRPALAVNSSVTSGTCQAKGTNLTTIVNADIGDGHTWIETQQDSPEVSRICFKTTNLALTSPTVTGVHGALMTIDGPATAPATATTWDCDTKLPTFTDSRLGTLGYSSQGTHGRVGVCWRSSLIGELSVQVLHSSHTLVVLD